MTAPRAKTPKAKQEIPEELIYEIWDGKPVYYAGYKEALKNRKPNEIIERTMPSSFLQVFIVSLIVKFLNRNISDNYFVGTNESGLHLDKNVNFANDIQIIDKKSITDYFSEKYLDFAPKIVVEVDIKASIENFNDKNDYFYKKTQRLLDFGVEKVIWVMSDVKKILIASPTGPWLIVNWHDDVEVFTGLSFNLTQLLKDEGVDI